MEKELKFIQLWYMKERRNEEQKARSTPVQGPRAISTITASIPPAMRNPKPVAVTEVPNTTPASF
jgi:hypothetical protein